MKHIYDIAPFCEAYGIKEIILCPGSRSAPLAIAFMRYPHIKTYVIPDERSAAFIGLGIAQQSKRPVALVCTSGTAALNFYPAITEAFYRNIPLLALTADRPPEWIDQLDGQTIRQENVYSNHIRASLTFPLLGGDKDLKIAENTLKIAFKHLQEGPVHINIPFEEPFYPNAEEKMSFSSFSSPDHDKPLETHPEIEELKALVQRYRNAIVVVGQQYLEYPIKKALEKLDVPIVTDVISNYRGIKNSTEFQDWFLTKTAPQVDLIITFGLSVISKNLKLYLRKTRPLSHWHLGPSPAADTFRCLEKTIDITPEVFFENIPLKCASKEEWLAADQQAQNTCTSFQESVEYGELGSIFRILNKIPQNSHLHLANSMPVRYANFISTKEKKLIVHANRGTSGIDGTLSTALGTALADPDKLHTLLIGDLSLFYDRNGLWHPYIPNNLRIVLINNHGGGIFRMIPGPLAQPELEEYFVTQQPLKADLLAQEHGLAYQECQDYASLSQALEEFYEVSDQAKLLEITTDGSHDAQLFKQFKAVPYTS